MAAPLINYPRIISMSDADGVARPRYIVYGMLWDEDLLEFRSVESADVESIPSGGLNGQVLVKASNADFDVEWSDVLGGAPAWGDITGVLADQADLQTALDAKATTAAVALKAPIDSPTFTGTVAGVSKAMVGLGNVDNTSDANKPISTATQTALDGKQPLDADLTAIAALTATTDNFMVAAASAWASRTPAQAKTSLALVKGDVGLGNVDNTSDANKPVSTATQTALDGKANTLGADDNYVTDAEKVKLSNLSGTNTGDQTLPTDATIVTTDVTTNNVTTSKHGWAPKGTAGTSQFWRQDWTLGTPTAVVADADKPATGSLTVDTAKYHVTGVRQQLTSTQRLTIAGTGRLRIQN